MKKVDPGMKKTGKIRYFYILTLVAFIINVMLPFFAVYNPLPVAASGNKQSYAKEMAPLFGEKVLVCTGDGFKWINWTDLQSGKKKPEPHPQYKCPLCYIAAHGIKHAIPAKVLELAYTPVAKQLSHVFPLSETIRDLLSTRNYPSRAPPASVIA